MPLSNFTVVELNKYLTLTMSGERHSGVRVVSEQPPSDEDVFKISKRLVSGNSPHSVEFDFSLGRISNQGVVSFCKALEHPNCPENVSASFYSAGVSFGDEGMLTFAQALASNKCSKDASITFLGGVGGMSDAGPLAIAQALIQEKYPEGLSIKFYNCPISLECIHTFAKVVINAGRTKRFALHFENCNISDKHIQVFSEGFKSGSCQLADLTIGFLANEVSSASVESLNHIIKSINNLKRFCLDLRTNSIDDKGAVAFAHAIESGDCPDEFVLKLWSNEISLSGATLLARALESKCRPKKMTLQFDGGGDNLAEVIAKTLESGNCRDGLCISVSGNEFTDKGAQIIIDAIRKNKGSPGYTINLLGFGFVTSASEKALVEALKHNTSIIDLLPFRKNTPLNDIAPILKRNTLIWKYPDFIFYIKRIYFYEKLCPLTREEVEQPLPPKLLSSISSLDVFTQPNAPIDASQKAGDYQQKLIALNGELESIFPGCIEKMKRRFHLDSSMYKSALSMTEGGGHSSFFHKKSDGASEDTASELPKGKAFGG